MNVNQTFDQVLSTFFIPVYIVAIISASYDTLLGIVDIRKANKITFKQFSLILYDAIWLNIVIIMFVVSFVANRYSDITKLYIYTLENGFMIIMCFRYTRIAYRDYPWDRSKQNFFEWFFNFCRLTTIHVLLVIIMIGCTVEFAFYINRVLHTL